MRTPTTKQTNDIMADFYNENINSSIGVFTQVADSIQKMLDIKTNLVIDSLTKNLNLLLLSFNDNQLALDDSSLSIAFKDSLTALNIAFSEMLVILQMQINELALESDSVYQHNAGLVQNLNAIVPYAIEQYDINEKTINMIYLTTYALGIDTFSTDQIEQLTSIALQCPHSGGPSVFIARQMLSSSDHISSFDDSSLCSSQAERFAWQEQVQRYNCSVFPNPASTVAYFSCELPSSITSSLDIFNILGVRVVHLSLSQYETYSVDVSKLLPGIYMYRVSTSSHVVLDGKLLINH